MDEHGETILLVATALVDQGADAALEHLIGAAYAHAHLTDTTPTQAGETLFKVCETEEWHDEIRPALVRAIDDDD